MEHVEELLERRRALRLDLVGNFIARAPHHHRGMIPVAEDHARDVPLPPFVEMDVVGVALLDLGHAPFVEGLVHDQESQLVAEVEELRGGRIVAGADGVAAHRAERFQAALPDPLGHGRAHATAVVMQADAVELHVLAVDQAALVGVETHLPDPQRRVVLVQDAVLILERGSQAVQVGRIDGPEIGIGNHEPGLEIPLTAGRDLTRFSKLGAVDDLPILVEEFRVHRVLAVVLAFILDLGHDCDGGGVLGDLRCGDDDAPAIDMHLARDQQPRMPVDARARVPAGVGLEGVVDADGQHVRAVELEVLGQIVGEADVAAGPLAERVAVDPDLAVLVDAVELDGDLLALAGRGQAKRLAIPADAGGQVGALVAGRFGPREGPFDAPVMGQVQGPPGRVVEGRCFGALCLAAGELPAVIHQQPLATRFRGACRHGSQASTRQDQGNQCAFHVSIPPNGWGLGATSKTSILQGGAGCNGPARSRAMSLADLLCGGGGCGVGPPGIVE